MVIKPSRPKRNGPKRGENFTDYVEGMERSNGERRGTAPINLSPWNALSFATGAAIYGKYSCNPMTVFDIGFGEEISPAVRDEILLQIHEWITIGLPQEEILFLLIAHQESKNDQSVPDAHLGYVNTLLTSGARWQPYYEQADRAFLTALTETLNYRYNLISPKAKDHLRPFLYHPRSGDPSRCMDLGNSIATGILERWRSGQIHSRRDLHRALEGMLDRARVTDHGCSFSIHLPYLPDLRFCGPLCDTRFNFADLDPSPRYPRKSQEAYERDLSGALMVRADRHEKLMKRSARNFRLPARIRELSLESKSEVLNFHSLINLQVKNFEGAISALPKLVKEGKSIDEILNDHRFSQIAHRKNGEIVSKVAIEDLGASIVLDRLLSRLRNHDPKRREAVKEPEGDKEINRSKGYLEPFH